jgi:hypothetical protein
VKLLAFAAAAMAALATAPGAASSGSADRYACSTGDTALDCYLRGANAAMVSCPMDGTIAIVKLRMSDRSGLGVVAACASEAKASVGKMFSATKAELARNDRALSLLKDHYAAWLVAVDDLAPGVESNTAYRARAADAQKRLKEMGLRVKLEM